MMLCLVLSFVLCSAYAAANAANPVFLVANNESALEQIVRSAPNATFHIYSFDCVNRYFSAGVLSGSWGEQLITRKFAVFQIQSDVSCHTGNITVTCDSPSNRSDGYSIEECYEEVSWGVSTSVRLHAKNSSTNLNTWNSSRGQRVYLTGYHDKFMFNLYMGIDYSPTYTGAESTKSTDSILCTIWLIAVMILAARFWLPVL